MRDLGPFDRRRLAAVAAAGLIGVGLVAGERVGDGTWLVLLGAAWVGMLVAMWPALPATVPPVKRATVQTAVVLVSVFALLGVQLFRTQVVLGEAIAARVAVDPATGEVVANPRRVEASLAGGRGRILDRNGEVLAETVAEGGGFRRVYPEPSAAPVVGYFSPRRYGATGLEAAFDAELTGRAGGNALERELDRLLGRAPVGLDLRLSLDAGLQRQADAALAGRRGAAVLLDARTGAVLALASSPHADPNLLAPTDPDDLPAVDAAWADLLADPGAPLLPRATQGLLTPGSTFKLVTAAAALEGDVANSGTEYRDAGRFEVEGHVVPDPNRPDETREVWTLTEALGWSLNAVFAQVGLQLGAAGLAGAAERFGFGQPIPFELPVPASRVVAEPGFLASAAALADTAFGQGQLQATPLQMALVAAAVANDGRMMRPSVVAELATAEGAAVRRTSPSVWRRPMGEAAAADLRAMMVWAVEDGGNRAAAIPGATVGGKTGSAETGTGGPPHAWFVGWADDGDRAYAVAVVIEEGGGGAAGALPLGRDLLAAALAIG